MRLRRSRVGGVRQSTRVDGDRRGQRRPPDSCPCRLRSRVGRCRGATRDRWAVGLAGGGSRRSGCRPPTLHRCPRRRPSGRRVPRSRTVGVEAVEDVEAVEGDDGRGADRAVRADRDDHEFGIAERGVRRTGHPAEQQPRSVRRPCRTRLVGCIRSGDLEPAGVLARPDEVDVASAVAGVECHPPVHDRRWRRGVGDDRGDWRSGRRGGWKRYRRRINRRQRRSRRDRVGRRCWCGRDGVGLDAVGILDRGTAHSPSPSTTIVAAATSIQRRPDCRPPALKGCSRAASGSESTSTAAARSRNMTVSRRSRSSRAEMDVMTVAPSTSPAPDRSRDPPIPADNPKPQRSQRRCTRHRTARPRPLAD